MQLIIAIPGVTITFSGEDDFQLFAPNPDAMAEAQEQIKTLMEHAVSLLLFAFQPTQFIFLIS